MRKAILTLSIFLFASTAYAQEEKLDESMVEICNKAMVSNRNNIIFVQKQYKELFNFRERHRFYKNKQGIYVMEYEYKKSKSSIPYNFGLSIVGLEDVNDFEFNGLRVSPKKGTKQYEFLRLIDDAVISGELKFLVPEGREENPLHPLYEISIYNTNRVMADEAWWWAVSIEGTEICKLPVGFMKMHREIMPLEFENHIGKMPAWNVGQFVRILFGERYQDPAHWPENTQLKNLIDRIEAEIKIKKLQPLDSLPYSEIETVGFRPLDLIQFWERYDNNLETLTWVKRLFLRIKEQEGDTKKASQTNAEPAAATLKERGSQGQPKKKREDKFTRSDPDGKIQDAVKKLIRKRNSSKCCSLSRRDLYGHKGNCGIFFHERGL